MKRLYQAWVVLLALAFVALLPGCAGQQQSAQPLSQSDQHMQSMLETPALMEPQGAAGEGKATPAPPEAEPPFTLIWMSDTQLYCQECPEIFLAMSDWTVENKSSLNMRYVLHTGDIVHKREQAKQWENAAAAIDPMMDALPFFVIAGNHDAWPTSYAEYIEGYGLKKFQSLPSAAGFYKEGMARYDLFSVGPHDFIIAGLGFYHDQGAVDFVNSALRANAGRTAILCLHSYLDIGASFTKEGEALHEQIVLANPNVKLVLCGHQHGVGKRVIEADDDADGAVDRRVLAMLADYQGGSEGGEGYLRILEFDPGAQQLSVRAYSPYLNEYREEEEESFVFPLNF